MPTQDAVINQDVQLEKLYFAKFASKPEGMGNFQKSIYAWYIREPPYWACDLQGFVASVFIVVVLTLLLGQLTEGMRKLCTLTADMSKILPTLHPPSEPGGPKFWRVDYTIILEFGGTQLRAALQWKEGVCVSLG